MGPKHACTVRQAQSGDLMAVLGVHARRDGGAAPVKASETERQTWARMSALPELVVYLAEMGDEVVGTSSIMIFPNLTYHCAPTAIIEAVVVVPARRRRGIATALLGRALEDAGSAGCNKIQLLSHKRHATDGAHRLYTALGFEPEAEGFRLYLGKVPESVEAARAIAHPEVRCPPAGTIPEHDAASIQPARIRPRILRYRAIAICDIVKARVRGS